MADRDEKLIIQAANRVGLEQWQLDREIVEVIKEALARHRFWHNIDSYIKERLKIQ